MMMLSCRHTSTVTFTAMPQVEAKSVVSASGGDGGFVSTWADRLLDQSIQGDSLSLG